MPDNYEQYSEEWRAQVMKHSKSDLVDLLAESYKDRSMLEKKLKQTEEALVYVNDQLSGHLS